MRFKIYLFILIGLLVMVTWIKPVKSCHAGHEHGDDDDDDDDDECITEYGGGDEEEIIILVDDDEDCQERRRRRRRSTGGDGSAKPAKNYSRLRKYFRDCMAHVEKEVYDWKTVVDFSILDTIWYEEAENDVCGDKDTVECWEHMLDDYLVEGSPRRVSASLCIRQYKEDIRYNSGVFNVSAITLKHHSPSRRKRGSGNYYWQMTEEQLRAEYSKCVQNLTQGTYRKDQKINSLLDFVNSDIKCGRCNYNNVIFPSKIGRKKRSTKSYHVQSSSNVVYVYHDTTTSPPTTTPPDRSNEVIAIINSEYRVQWPFTLQALTKKNAILSRAFEKCNRQFDREFKKPPPKLPWTSWGSWTRCKATCSKPSAQFRIRSCQSGVGECPGKSIDSKNCFSVGCAVWGKWSQWSPCSVTCGVGTQKSTRKCSRPGACIGPSEKSDVCGQRVCYGSWTSWSGCQPHCGKRKQYSYKFCTQSTLKISCSSLGNKTRLERSKGCSNEPCFGPWGDFSECSVSCGSGVTISRRSCLSSGVVSCRPKDLIRENACYKRACSGLWSGWSNWSQCTKSCGGLGVRIRRRECTGTDPCKGSKKERKNCKYISCKPAWSNWSSWSSCNLQKKERMCVNGSPGEGSCQGDWELYRECEGCSQTTTTSVPTTISTTRSPSTATPTTTPYTTTPYPTSFEEAGVIWSQWEPWSHCSVTCGVGTVQRQKRAISCAGRQPYVCEGTASERRTCNMGGCEVTQSHHCSDLSPSYCQDLNLETCSHPTDQMLCRRTCRLC